MKKILLIIFAIMALLVSVDAESPSTKINISKKYLSQQGKVNQKLTYTAQKLFYQDSGPMVVNNKKMSMDEAFVYANMFIEFIKNGWYESFNLNPSKKNVIMIDNDSMISIEYNASKQEWCVDWKYAFYAKKDNIRKFYLE